MATTVLRPWGRRHDALVRVAAALDFLFGLLYALLAIRLALVLLGARMVGFVRFILALSDPFYTPFRGILPTGTVDAHPVAWSIVFAIVVYAILHAILRSLLRVMDRA